jgi:hypothetical protein
MEREQKAEVFVALMADLTRNIFEMINGNTVQENLGAVTAICLCFASLSLALIGSILT